MPRIDYSGEGNNFRKLVNNAPQVSAAYWELRRALNEGVLSAKLWMLSFLSSDTANSCRY